MKLLLGASTPVTKQFSGTVELASQSRLISLPRRTNGVLPTPRLIDTVGASRQVPLTFSPGD